MTAALGRKDKTTFPSFSRADVSPQMTGRQNGLDSLRPFEYGHGRILQNIIKSYRFGLISAADAIKIEMIKPFAIAPLVLMRQIETGTGQGDDRAPADADTAAEGRLASAKLTRKADSVAGPQKSAQRRAKLFGLLGTAADDVQAVLMKNGDSPNNGIYFSPQRGNIYFMRVLCAKDKLFRA